MLVVEASGVPLALPLDEFRDQFEHARIGEVREDHVARELFGKRGQFLAGEIRRVVLGALQELTGQVHAASCRLLRLECAEPDFFINGFPLGHPNLRDKFL